MNTDIFKYVFMEFNKQKDLMFFLFLSQFFS